MKSKTLVAILAMSAIIFSLSYDHSRAEQQAPGQMKMGVLSVQKIFKDCKRSAAYRDKVMAERQQIEAELEKLNKEIEADKAGLKTLKQDSGDYLATMKDVLTKTSSYQAQQKFYEQQASMSEQRMIETLYQDIMRETANVASEKGLGVVFERSEPQLPAASGNELTLTISTHKVLYSAGCVDITNEVMAKLDAK